MRSFVRKRKLWNGLLMRRECRWSLGNQRLPTQPRLLSHFVIPPISYSCPMLLLTFLLTSLFTLDVPSPDATPHSASCKMIIPERKNSALWSLPCHEKLLWQTLQRLNKATRSITQRQLTDSDLCQRAGWGWWFLFFLLLSWQQAGREDVYD